MLPAQAAAVSRWRRCRRSSSLQVALPLLHRRLHRLRQARQQLLPRRAQRVREALQGRGLEHEACPPAVAKHHAAAKAGVCTADAQRLHPLPRHAGHSTGG